MFRITITILTLLACPFVALAQGNVPSGCPEVTVTGPPGVTLPGESITFTVNVEIDDPEKFSYSWLVSGGEIVEGQGKPWIRVLTSQADNGKTLKATVKVLELATQCINTAEGEAVVQGGGPSNYA